MSSPSSRSGDAQAGFQWRVDPQLAASALSPIVAPVVQRGFVHIDHREPTVSVHLSITMNGEPVDVRFERPSTWDGDALALGQGSDAERGFDDLISHELQDSGHRLRAAEELRGAGRTQDNVWVFDRAAHA